MSVDQDSDDLEGFGRIRKLFSRDGFLGMLLSLFGLGTGSAKPANIVTRDELSYSDIERGDGSLPLDFPVEKARRALQATRDGTFDYETGINSNIGAVAQIDTDVENGPDVIRRWLARAGQDASALDPTGKKTAAEMEAEIRDAPRLGHIARARRYFDAIRNPRGDHGATGEEMDLSNDPAELARRMATELEKANRIALANGGKAVDFSTLDPTGTKSSEQMQEMVHERIIEGCVINARMEFNLLKRSEGMAETEPTQVQVWLDKANAAALDYGFKPIDASILDNSGKASAAEMNRELQKTIEEVHLRTASYYAYEGQPRSLDDARGELEAANKIAVTLGEKPKAISDLNPNDGKRLDHRLEQIAMGVYNMDAKVSYNMAFQRRLDAALDEALRNEPTLAGLIRPLGTPESSAARQSRQKE